MSLLIAHLYSGGILELAHLFHNDPFHVDGEEGQAVPRDQGEGVVGLKRESNLMATAVYKLARAA